MDPSIMKLLEEDEDESMHSGADVDAFTAALNRDIEGGSSNSQNAHPDISFSQQENNQMPSQMYSQRQPSSQEENSVNEPQHQALSGQEHQSSEVEKEQGSSMEIRQEVNASQAVSDQFTRPDQVDGQRYTVDASTGEVSKASIPSQSQTYGLNHPQVHEQSRMLNTSNESQFSNMQKVSNQAVPAPEQGGSSVNRGKQIPFGSLLPLIIPELDKDKAMQLQTLFTKLRKNEIPKDAFVRLMRNIVGDHMLRVAVVKMQAKSQNPGQQQHMRPPAGTGAQISDPYSFGQLHQKSHSTPTMTRTPVSVMQPVKDSAMSMQGLSKQQQQHLPFPQGSFPMYAATSYHPFTGTNVGAPSTLANPPSHEPQIRQGQFHQGFGSAHGDSTSHTMNVMNTPKVERQNSINDANRIPGMTMANMGTPSMQHAPVPWQVIKEQKIGTSPTVNFVKQESAEQGFDKQQKPQIASSQGPPGVVLVEQGESLSGLSRPATVTHMDTNFQVGSQSIPADAMGGTGNNSKTSAKKPSSGQKKPLDALASSPPLPSKKQKVSGGAFSDQSIEHLNDVTAVSGVNLREEEEQLLSGPKDDSRVSEASRKAVQEEEDRLILQKAPLQKKLAEIMTKYGLKNLSNDVERCLSLCVEERMRGLISRLIRVSKQRADSEKSRHTTIVTSDVREQIMTINRKAREEWDKKQAGAEKLRKQNEPDSSEGFDADNEKDEARAKSLKMQVNKEEDDKMRTTAANVAARAAVGGDDMLSKWQLMAQARQKREGGAESATSSQATKDVINKQAAASIRNVKETSGAGKRDLSTALPASVPERQSGRRQVSVPPPRVSPCISVKDVISVLEQEPQMAKSTIIYRLYGRVHTDPAAE